MDLYKKTIDLLQNTLQQVQRGTQRQSGMYTLHEDLGN